MGAISKTIGYHKISEGQKEILRKDYWMMEFTRIPKGVYFPGQELINIRLKDFDPGFSTDDPQILDASVRGVVIKQAAGPTNTAGQCSYTIQDREDQTLSYFYDQWKLMAGDRAVKSGMHKEFYTAEIVFTMYNIFEVPVRKITLQNVMPPTGNFNESGAEDPTLLDALSISHDYEHADREFLNKSTK